MMGQELITAFQEAYDVGVEPFVSPLYNVGGHIMDGDWVALAEFFPYAYGGDLHSGIYVKEGWEAVSQESITPSHNTINLHKVTPRQNSETLISLVSPSLCR